MRHVLALLDAFFLTRPLLLAPGWGFSVFGLFRGLSAGGRAPMNMLWTVRHNGATFGWMAIFSLSVASVYVLNQIADVNVDKFNKGLPLLAKGKLSLAAAWWTAILCLALSILLPFFSHPSISAFSCGAALLGIAYSFRPLRFSGRPCFDFLTNAAGYGLIAFGVGWHLSGAAFSVAGFAASALPYFLLMCAGSISSTFPDYEGDKKCGKITTAVALGVRRAHAVATVSLCSSLAVSVALGDAIALTCAAGALPFYIFYCIRPGVRAMEATYKGGGLLCMAAAAVLMPVVAIVTGVLAISTRLYFNLRHHVSYPTLVPIHHEK
jgi:4-hydroxybenzoate polyprenyltransferase